MSNKVVIEKVLSNIGKEPVKLSFPPKDKELEELCKRQFGWNVSVHNEIENAEKALLIKPKLICLRPFLLFSAPTDNFYEALQKSNRLIIYLSAQTRFMNSLSDVFNITNEVYGKPIYSGLRMYSLSSELLIKVRFEFKVILVNDIQSENRIVHTLIG